MIPEISPQDIIQFQKPKRQIRARKFENHFSKTSSATKKETTAEQ
jgi:hypothetical protein